MKKLIPVLLALIFFNPVFAMAELTKKDLEGIRSIVKEEIAHVDKRMDMLEGSVDKRFEQIDKRLEFMQNLMIGMLAVFGGLCGVFVGLLLWDRKTFKEKAKEEAMREIEEKYKIKVWLEALREYARIREDWREVLNRLRLL